MMDRNANIKRVHRAQQLAPTNWDELIQRLQVFSSKVRQARQQPAPEISWYPYDTLGSLRNFESMLRKRWERF